MPGYRDWDMLNQAITGFGDDAARRRQQNVINSREAERIALEREMREIQRGREDRMEQRDIKRGEESNRRFNLMLDREDRMRDTAMKPTYEWTSGGVKHTAHSLQDFGQMIQEHPADPTKDDFSELDLSGTNEHGVAVRQKIRIPSAARDSQPAKEAAAKAIKAFAEYTGSVSTPEPEVFTTPQGQEFVKRGKQLIKGAPAPAPGSTTTTIKTEPPPPWAPPGTKPTNVTNTTTRVPNAPAVAAATPAHLPPPAVTAPAPARKHQPWEPPPKISFDPKTTHPELAKLLAEANDALLKGADWGAVTNELSNKYGITIK